ncbi:MAG: hypothetical protein LiPW41_32 [Parcubacteria group bacterium LiPW_41]|nr:MAG: hypothetical protein LiPW41_32 [Parcubacteria group bacterium LiPW_41]
MKQRYISLVLSVVVLFLSAGILIVRGQQDPFGPDAPFPGGLKSKPVDTGNTGQEKPGDLNLKTLRFGLNTDPGATNVTLSGKIVNASSNNFIDLNDLSLGINIQNGSGPVSISAFGPFRLYTKGLQLPIDSGTTPAPGTIYYDSTGDGKVKLYNKKGWTDIGTGSGTGGTNFWVKGTGTEIYYDGGDVYVGSIDSIPVKYYRTGTIISFNNNPKQYSLIKKVLAERARPQNILKCDTNPSYFECPNPYVPQAGDNNTLGALGYDEGYSCDKYPGYSLEGVNCVTYKSCGSIDNMTCIDKSVPADSVYDEFILTRQGASSGKLVAGKIVFSPSGVIRTTEVGSAYNGPAQNQVQDLGEHSFCALGKMLHDGSNGGYCDVYYNAGDGRWKMSWGKWGSGGIACRANCF